MDLFKIFIINTVESWCKNQNLYLELYPDPDVRIRTLWKRSGSEEKGSTVATDKSGTGITQG
jgi:hypothetical protein